ncbi:hypothetical protein X801_01426 [Opisthorchis viverrini]|uniref:Bromo domain-containing protein n=1 Tax=Opisthorchis viverrini TaxID=6198 RepID=A0A1S8X7K2_OPIVI|nr:hypothetical protein X801_01426 [Opisthorchis viverrini]
MCHTNERQWQTQFVTRAEGWSEFSLAITAMMLCSSWQSISTQLGKIAAFLPVTSILFCLQMSLVQTSASPKCGPGHITLESLLDSPGMTPSPLSESINDGNNCEYTVQDGRFSELLARDVNPTDSNVYGRRLFMTELQRQAVLREFCIELLFVLRNQDVNGYFLSFTIEARSPKESCSHMGLLTLEKRLLSNGYRTLNEFKTDVSALFSGALRHYPVDTLANSEAQRLLNTASDWFASLPLDYVDALNVEPTRPQQSLKLSVPDRSALDEFSMETALAILNPDNHGIVNRNERIRPIGEEVGSLKSGSYLLPNGGYREDRRNKVIPYTYLNYGPFYSFAPHYDSGASHCSPEANQLVLGTSWLPARTTYLTVEPQSGTDLDTSEVDDEVSKSIRSDAVCSALAIGDQQLAVSLAVADMEQRATNRLAAELDEILPGPEVSEDCVFSMCLANAFTIDLLRDRRKSDEKNETNKLCTLTEECKALVDLDELEQATAVEDDPSKANVDALSDSANDIIALYRTQYRRLGDISQTAAMSGSTLVPSPMETSIAHRFVNRMVNMTKRVRPRDIVHPYAVRRAMGMKPEIAPLPDDDSNIKEHLEASELICMP